MPPLRLTYVIPFGPPATQFGGPVAQLGLIAPALAQRGHDLRLVCTDLGIDPAMPRDTWLQRDGYRIYYGRTKPIHRVAPYWTPMLRDVLRETIADSDLVHLHLGLTLLNALARRIAVHEGVPYVYAPRGSLCPYRLRERRWGKWLFLRLFERRIIRDAAALHALTEKERDDLTSQGGDPQHVHIVPNAVDMGAAETWPTRAAARAQLDVPDDAVAVVFMSQLHPVKGLDLLLHAAASLRPRHPELILLIAGPDKGYGTEARRLVRELGLDEAVRFLGHVASHEQKLAVLRAADVFALTSYSEGLPNAVLEACHVGLPVLITDACHLPEVAAHEAGCVVPAKAQLVEAGLGSLLAAPARRAAMGRAARLLAEDRFSVARVVDGLEAIYTGAIGDMSRDTRAVTAVDVDDRQPRKREGTK
ncbi:MAG: glycosyltransferase [Phycisphaeraceae bacterium]